MELETEGICVATGFYDSIKQSYIINLTASWFHYFQKAKKKAPFSMPLENTNNLKYV